MNTITNMLEYKQKKLGDEMARLINYLLLSGQCEIVLHPYANNNRAPKEIA